MSAELDGHGVEVKQAFAGAPQRVECFRAVLDDGITSRSALDHALLTVDAGVGSDGDGTAASPAN